MRSGLRSLRAVADTWTTPTLRYSSLNTAWVFDKICLFSCSNRPLQGHRHSLHTKQTAHPLSLGYSKPEATASLPWTCPGCGAYTQNLDPSDAGFYTVSRKPVKAFLEAQQGRASSLQAGDLETVSKALQNVDETVLRDLGLEANVLVPALGNTNVAPICDRCHDLMHHHRGRSIIHPTVQSIQDIISQSPYKYNHVYHVLDAADFPLSLIPQLQKHLELMPQRSRNRRSKTEKFHHGRKAAMSFVITRSDLLAATKEQVESLMPYLVQVLREALGSSGKEIRLGNVRCVSSRRGWWTKKVKEDIWNRGGGGWMVGKVNVGKSNLFESVFPKGRNEDMSFQSMKRAALQNGSNRVSGQNIDLAPHSERALLHGQPILRGSKEYDEDDQEELALLPPVPEEMAFPTMPTVSCLPGTTASPIRLLFGGGKGELVDLPGLSRGDLQEYVREEHKPDLVMQHRVKAEQYSIKPGQSLLIGGLIRITPLIENVITLAYPFVPLECHVTSTAKAVEIHTQTSSSGTPNIAKPGIGGEMSSAGVYKLYWDVTRKRAGPLTAHDAVGLKSNALPFVIFSTDILVEGCGWIEVVAQVRRKTTKLLNTGTDGPHEGMNYPSVEVFSPNGKHISARRPMNAWILGGIRPKSMRKSTQRPRRSMKGVKKESKRAKRAA